MSRRHLTIRQRSALRRIENRLAADDPDLARELRGASPSGEGFRIGWLPPLALVLTGAGFALVGLLLEVGSAIFLGIALCYLGKLRRDWLRRHRPLRVIARDVRRSNNPHPG